MRNVVPNISEGIYQTDFQSKYSSGFIAVPVKCRSLEESFSTGFLNCFIGKSEIISHLIIFSGLLCVIISLCWCGQTKL